MTQQATANPQTALDLLHSQVGMLDKLSTKLCTFFNELGVRLDRFGRNFESFKLLIPVPSSGPDDNRRVLIIPFNEDGWDLTLTEYFPNLRGGCTMHRTMVVQLGLDPLVSLPTLPVSRPKYALDDMTRLLTTCERFLADPDSVIAQSGTHCVFCGKPLTDSVSKARGIGPDCMERYGDVIRHLRSHDAVEQGT